MKVAPLFILPLIVLSACDNRYGDSPTRWETTKPVKHVTPAPSPGNPYAPPEKVAKVPDEDAKL